MEKLVERSCGLDVHRDTVSACVRVPGQDAKKQEIVQTFGTMTEELLALRDWLKAHEVTHVAMESTGVFWKPVYHLLENDFTVLLVNAAHIKNVPGRKTDVKDCAWIAELLEHGLLSGSFVPPEPIRDLRDLTRHRKALVQERARGVQRLHKLLQDAGIKLSSVATNIMGVSGRAMLEAMLEDSKNPTAAKDATALADLAKGRLRAKLPALRKALEGRFRRHHGFMTSEILSHVDYLDEALERLTKEIDEVIRPFVEEVTRLITIPGVERKTAEVIVAEIGVDMKQFPSAQHLASWAGLCPGNNESAGKHRSGKTRKGDRWLRTALVEAAQAVTRSRNTYLSAHYQRIARRQGHRKAIVAVAHSILVMSYHMMSRKTSYHELGRDFFERKNQESIKRRCIRQLERLGLNVVVTEKEAAA